MWVGIYNSQNKSLFRRGMGCGHLKVGNSNEDGDLTALEVNTMKGNSRSHLALAFHVPPSSMLAGSKTFARVLLALLCAFGSLASQCTACIQHAWT